MNPLALLSPKLWLAIGLAVALAASHWMAYRKGEASVRAEWAVERLETAKASLRVIEARDRTQGDLEALAAKNRREANARIHSLDLELAESLRRLRNRPERPGGDGDVPAVAGVGGTSTGCTGAGLYKADAEFLARLFAGATRLQSALSQCYAQYRAAREALMK